MRTVKNIRSLHIRRTEKQVTASIIPILRGTEENLVQNRERSTVKNAFINGSRNHDIFGNEKRKKHTLNI